MRDEYKEIGKRGHDETRDLKASSVEHWEHTRGAGALSRHEMHREFGLGIVIKLGVGVEEFAEALDLEGHEHDDDLHAHFHPVH